MPFSRAVRLAGRAMLCPVLVATVLLPPNRAVRAQSAQDAAQFHDALPESGKVYSILRGDGTRTDHVVDDSEVMDIIVRFKGDPLFIAQKSGQQASKTSMQALFARFESDVAAIISASRAGKGASGGAGKSASKAAPNGAATGASNRALGTLRRTYQNVFYGASLSVPAAAVSDIRRLDYVADVSRSRIVTTALETVSAPPKENSASFTLIGADRVWEDFQTRGAGVSIAIIDTGIDYTHPSLGGGYGEGFKVVGGYDIVNEDEDPMDDNEHGTHVAGIAAGNGDVLGVAPEATLYAYKMLNEFGVGATEDLIVAIEMALDPDADGDMSDAVDIINMSLGSRDGGPDSPESIAVDNATELGVTIIAAAGNNGAFFNVDSPGAARRAITVGATNDSDELALFSSKGPNKQIYEIKPDVTAPGVAILSSVPGGGTAAFSGTSMATPHVAGAAALLRAAHPTWPPDRIKAALMNTAVDVDLEVMEQGAGRIDVLAAAGSEGSAFPGAVDFGLASLESPTWEAAREIVLANESEEECTWTVSIEGNATGYSLSGPASVTVAPGATETVTFSLQVDHDLVPFPTEGALAFGGAVTLESQTGTLRLPWAFVKGIDVSIRSDEILRFFVLTDVAYDGTFSTGTPVVLSTEDNPFQVNFLAPASTYDLTVDVSRIGPDEIQHWVFLRNLEFSDSQDLTVSRTDAKHTLTIAGVDENGVPLSANGTLGGSHFGIEFRGESSQPILISAGAVNDHWPEIRVSDVSGLPMSLLEFQDDLETHQTVRTVVHEFDEVTTDMTLQNDPADLGVRSLSMRMEHPVFSPWGIRFEPVQRLVSRDGQLIYFIFRNELAEFPVEGSLWEGTVVTTADTDRPAAYTSILEATTGHPGDERLHVHAFPFSIWNGRVVSAQTFAPGLALFAPPEDEVLSFGSGPLHPRAVFDNNGGGSTRISSFGLIEVEGMLEEIMVGDRTSTFFELYDEEENVIASGNLDDFTGFAAAAEPHRFHMRDHNYVIAGGQGLAVLDAEFDLSLSDPNPPSIATLRITDGAGKLSRTLSQDEAAAITFAAFDYTFDVTHLDRRITVNQPIAEAILQYRLHDTEAWIDLPSVSEGEDPEKGQVFTADLSPATAVNDTAVDLRLSVSDGAGNRMTWSLEPAFTVGDFVFPVSSEEDPHIASELPRRVALWPNYPNPFNPSTTIRYELPDGGHTRLAVYDVLGRRVALLVDEVRTAGVHTVRFDARSLASGLYLYRLETGSSTLQRTMILHK